MNLKEACFTVMKTGLASSSCAGEEDGLFTLVNRPEAWAIFT